MPAGTGSWPCAGSTGKGSENKWTTLLAPREVGSGAALTPFLSQTDTFACPLPPAAPSHHREVGVNYKLPRTYADIEIFSWA